MGLRTGGRRAKSLKNRVKSSKIEIRFRKVRSEGCSSRTSVQQEIIKKFIRISEKPLKPSVLGAFFMFKYLRVFIKIGEFFTVAHT